jgi:hypothetical protein
MPHNQASATVPLDVPVTVTMNAFRGLALLIEHDNKNLDEIVALIARLSMPIE